MSKIDIRKLRARSIDVNLILDDGSTQSIEVKPLKFKKFIDITEKYNKKFTDAEKNKEQNVKSMLEMLKETLRDKVEYENEQELDELIEEISFQNTTILIDAILQVNGLKDKLNSDELDVLEKFRVNSSSPNPQSPA